jgi:uncharacterized protein
MIMKKNPVFWLMWFLPASAVCASLATLAIAIDGADPRLPAAYHWEGTGLDRDFERARRAAALGIAGTLEVRDAARECAVILEAALNADSLVLLLTHSRDPRLDRQVLLRRSSSGEFVGGCEALPSARWRIALGDTAGEWSLRTEVNGHLGRVALRAREPGGHP